MGKTPGKWIKTLLLGKKSPKSNSANESKKLRSAKKEDLVVSMNDEFSNLSVDPPVVSSQPESATTTNPQNAIAPNNGNESKVNLESRNDLEELEHAIIKVQAAFRAHQARRAFRTLKGIIRLQAVIRGHLVRRQAVATYSCIWGIVKFQALVRGRKVRSSDNGIQLKKTHMEAGDSGTLKLNMYSWMDNPTKFFIVDKLLASSQTALPLKIQYGPEQPNSAKVWLERWTQLQVWSPGSPAGRSLVPKCKTKKRNYQAVGETEKARPKRGVKKQFGPNRGTGSNRSTAESEKPKRSVRKASTLSKDPLKTENHKAKHISTKSRSDSKEGSSLEVKDKKPRRKMSSVSNGSEKATRKSSDKKKDTIDSVQIEPEVKVSDVLEGGEAAESTKKEIDTENTLQKEPEVKVSDVLEGEEAVESTKKEKDVANPLQTEPEVKVSDVLEGEEAVESTKKEKDIANPLQTEPEVKVSDVLEGGEAADSTKSEKDVANYLQIEPEAKVSDILEGGNAVESAEKEKDTKYVVPKEFGGEKEENSLEEDETRMAETNDIDIVEDLKCSEKGNIGSDNTQPSERRVSLPTDFGNQDEGLTHNRKKIPSYMVPTASAKARVKGESSPRFAQEKTEKNGKLWRHSLPSPANGKLSTTTMSPSSHRLLLSSAKGSTNGNKSFSSSKNITDKSNRTEWKR